MGGRKAMQRHPVRISAESDMKDPWDLTCTDAPPSIPYATRDVLMRAAIEVLKNAEAISDLNVRSICQHANVSRATFYRNWTDAQDCLSSALDTAFNPIILNLKEEVTPQSIADLTLTIEELMTRPEMKKSIGIMMVCGNSSSGFLSKLKDGISFRRKACKNWLENKIDFKRSDIDSDMILDTINGLVLQSAVMEKRLERQNLIIIFSALLGRV
jgi:AcrR family transcriptional regulator